MERPGGRRNEDSLPAGNHSRSLRQNQYRGPPDSIRTQLLSSSGNPRQFDKARSLSDSVLFEFGPSRPWDLELRSCIRQWQPHLRALFLMRIASLKYRYQFRGFEWPENVRLLHQAYDDHSAHILEEMAESIERDSPHAGAGIEESHELLNAMVEGIQGEEPAQLSPDPTESFILRYSEESTP